MEEIWKDVKDYEEYYEVSNMGRVRSKNRRVRWGNNSFFMGIAREYGLAPTSICNCCKRRYHYYSYKGYKWFYGTKRNQS